MPSRPDPKDTRPPLPLLPLRDVVLFPGAVAHLLVGRERSVAAVAAARDADGELAVFAQREPTTPAPGSEDLHPVGTLARLHQHLRQPDGTVRITLSGVRRLRLEEVTDGGGHPVAHTSELPDEVGREELAPLVRQARKLFGEYTGRQPRLDEGVLELVDSEDDPAHRADLMASCLFVPAATRQRLLAEPDLPSRLRLLVEVLRRELELLRNEARRSQAEPALDDSDDWRRLRREAGLGEEDEDEVDEYLRRLERTELPEEARDVAQKEIGRLAKMPAMSPESAVIRNYLDVLLGLPWSERSEDHLDTRRAKKQLDADHYGLDKVKERILEYLSVVKLSGKLHGSILCLVGPPGVGKTSLGRSIAEAMGRKFVRVSLGGVHDESEIRGHRRTYIGSKPGRVLEGMRRAGVRNPVFLLDEIDKLGSDFRGDPSAALLEVLDPEQNRTYSDHFVEVPFDLSEVFFVCTANNMHQIPEALMDRMEILRLPGYLQGEKVAIAREFLLPRMRERHGLGRTRFTVTEPALADIVQLYTRESGVRELERQLARICRKVARAKAERRKVPRQVQRTNLHRFLGAPKYLHRMVEERPELGVVTALAWTPVGGEILEIEAVLVPGKGKLLLTGNLKDVMKESAQAALSFARHHAAEASKVLDEHDIHIHVPEGAVPKDGPSAGVAMAVAIVSLLTGRKVRRDVAMTGELTLRGKVLAIGGLPEKAVAAQAAGCRTILIPRDNDKDYSELPRAVRRGLEWQQISRVEEALEAALLPAGDEESRPRAGRGDEDSPGLGAGTRH